MPTYLVTGGAGFIGSHLVRGLLERGAAVRVLDNFATGRRVNLADLGGALELCEGDIRDLNCVRGAARGVEAIFHEAALPSVARSIADPLSSNAVNVGGTTNVILAARDEGVRRVVYASSSSVYGDSPTLPKIETMEPAPLSPYAIQKLAGEHYARIALPLFGVEVISLRYFNVFGPRQDPTSDYAAVIPRFITAILRNVPPTIFGDGLQSRDFTYVDNVVEANLRALDASPEAPGQAVNVACGERYTLLDLVKTIASIVGRADVVPRHAVARAGDVRHSQASIEKARKLLGFVPPVGFREGLEKTVAWYAANRGPRPQE
jgi:UDP-glucose 4-epimerase